MWCTSSGPSANRKCLRSVYIDAVGSRNAGRSVDLYRIINDLADFLWHHRFHGADEDTSLLFPSWSIALAACKPPIASYISMRALEITLMFFPFG